jgi:TusA-related sulfurtransferase
LARFLVWFSYSPDEIITFFQRLVWWMNKIARIDLSGVPWPLNVLKCYQHAGKMQSGDKMVISLRDNEVKENLVLLLNAMPELRFEVSASGPGFVIKVIK